MSNSGLFKTVDNDGTPRQNLWIKLRKRVCYKEIS